MKKAKNSSSAKKGIVTKFGIKRAKPSPIIDTAGGEMPDADAPPSVSRKDAHRAFKPLRSAKRS